MTYCTLEGTEEHVTRKLGGMRYIRRPGGSAVTLEAQSGGLHHAQKTAGCQRGAK